MNGQVYNVLINFVTLYNQFKFVNISFVTGYQIQ